MGHINKTEKKFDDWGSETYTPLTGSYWERKRKEYYKTHQKCAINYVSQILPKPTCVTSITKKRHLMLLEKHSKGSPNAKK